MKYFILFILGVTIMASFNSCIGCSEEDMDEFYEGYKDGYYGEDRDRNQW